jgi:diguanylate cyclase (GGDEF)-like protein/PAS domain S-box-containing protein
VPDTAGAHDDVDRTDRTQVLDVLAGQGVRSVFQPIVDLASGAVMAYEALARGPVGPLQNPEELFDAARRAGLLSELDAACRSAAFRGAGDLGLVSPVMVFVNVEPEVVDGAPLSELLAIAEAATGDLRIVLEITERALATRPAELLRTVERVRELGWGVALDDVGAEPASLAFMSLLRPDVVKLDMALVQAAPSAAIAEVMNSVNAYAERSGAFILAEGIENEEHLATALALGATLGQGWFFGRPTPDPVPVLDVRGLELPSDEGRVAFEALASPFECLPEGAVLRRAPKRLLIELSKQLERQAMQLGETCVIASTFQYSHHFTPATALRYRDLVARTGFVCALGEGLALEPIPGVRGASLRADDPIRGEWDVVVLSPHFSAALLARDLGDTGPDMERSFEYALTYGRAVVRRAARQMLLRVAPREAPPAPSAESTGATDVVEVARAALAANEEAVYAGPDRAVDPIGDALVRRALAASISGVTISDMTRPDQPMMYTNAAFDRLAGFAPSELVGRNCRLLQGPDTDHAAVSRIRTAIEGGVECRELLLNYRGPHRQPWWNEVHLSPVRNGVGRVVQYIGVQNDVTARINAERALAQERDRGAAYVARIEQLAYTDSLTGLMNRRRFEDRFESALLNARMDQRAVALLFLDLDGFKAVNDSQGHAAGDSLLQTVAARLQGRLRGSDLLARLGGDEFLVALTGLDPEHAAREAQAVGEQLASAVAQPVLLPGGKVRVTASIGISACPIDAEDFGHLFHLADLRMYELKHPTVSVR